VRALVLSSCYAEPTRRGKLRALAGLGCDLTAAVPGGEAAVDGGVRIAPVPVRGELADPATLRWRARRLKRLLTDTLPDLVQIEEEPETPAAHTSAMLCRRLRIPYVLFSWESLRRRLGLFQHLRARRTLSGSAGVIGGNHLAEALLRNGAVGKPSLALPQHGIALPPTHPASGREALELGFIGRLVPERGLDLLIHALGQTMGKWHLTVVGTGPEQEPVEELVQRLGLASRVRWLGGVRREAIDALWPELDCLVIPSRETTTWVERHSPLLLEAMARGIAAVVTQSGALPELVGEAGVVVRDLDELVLALQELVAHPEKARALGALGRRRVQEHYVDDAIAARTLEFWNGMVAAQRAARPAGA